MTSLNLIRTEEPKPPATNTFYATPDGEDSLKKLIYCAKQSAFFGFFAASTDIILYSHPRGYGAILGRYAYTTIPVTAIGAAFSAATSGSALIRKKDDKINHAIGGLAAGGVWGVWKKSYKFGIYGSFVLALFAMVVKDSYQNDWDFFSKSATKMPYTPFWIRQDWSIVSDPGRTWKKSNE